jgi:2-polyprenyl-3-methyl-5-hydroxy-6-metoxy-1,4-benzoquinol methylase
MRLSNLLKGRRGKSWGRTSDGRTLFGFHIDRMHGMSELLRHVQGKSVFDAGCNRGLIPFAFAMHGARVVHGCDNYTKGIEAAREIFDEVDVDSRFEVVDLTGGEAAIKAAFGSDYLPRYDVVLFVGMYHILSRIMPAEGIAELMQSLFNRTGQYFVCRTTLSAEPNAAMDAVMQTSGFTRVHYSFLTRTTGALSVWERM